MADTWKWRCYHCRAKGKGTYQKQAHDSTRHMFATGHSVSGRWVDRWLWAKSVFAVFVVASVAVLVWRCFT